eukprot:SM000222S06973  [mRNA]  locus=s222:140907:151145:+ [translate_table: standard]
MGAKGKAKGKAGGASPAASPRGAKPAADDHPAVPENAGSPGSAASAAPADAAAEAEPATGSSSSGDAVANGGGDGPGAVDAASSGGKEDRPAGAAEPGAKAEEAGQAQNGVDAGEAGDDYEDDIPLYPVMVKGPGGEEIELRLNPGDTLMDLRQFLSDAPETCFYTCYDIILTAPDGVRYHLFDFVELGDVADISGGKTSLEMLNALYDDRSVRVHVRKTRELLSMSSCFSSLSTKLSKDHEAAGAGGLDKAEGGGARKQAKDAKPPLPAELELLGFVENTDGLLASLVSPPAPEGLDFFESISFSSFNPVPGHRRLQGDLFYLDVVLHAKSTFCVTAHTQGFTVNRSKGSVLDARPREPLTTASTLIGLLKTVSNKFATGFVEVLEAKTQMHPFENMAPPLTPNTWLGPHPLPDHKRDVARAEDALISPHGTDLLGVQRDWNEELQSCRELPDGTLQERIMRDRALFRVSCEFVEAAVKGAKAVIGRSIPAINPADPDRFHMYVHNNIFYSFAVDGDFLVLQQLREQEILEQQQKQQGLNPKSSPTSAEAEQAGSGSSAQNEIQEEAVQATSGNGTASSGAAETGNQPATVVSDIIVQSEQVSVDDESVDTKGPDAGDKPSAEGDKVGEEAAQDASQAAETAEQATYASANNDLRGTRALNEANVKGLHTLAMALVDYRGHRVIAQSIIPGILYGDKTASLLYGSVENGKKINWNEKFHDALLEAGRALHIKEHRVEDGKGGVVLLCAPAECKGIEGADDRRYILDLMRATPRDANYLEDGLSAQRYILRPELVSAFCKAQEAAAGKVEEGQDPQHLDKSKVTSILKPVALETSEGEPADKESKEHAVEENKDGAAVGTEAAGNTGAPAAVLLNPNVFTSFKLAGSPEEIAADEELVRKAGTYLVDSVLPRLVKDFTAVDLSPMDGQTLSEALQGKGVNVRYLGKLTSLTKELPHIYQLCIEEMIVRSAKKVLKAVLRETLDHDVGGAIAHFINCLLGAQPLAKVAASGEPERVAAEAPPSLAETSEQESKPAEEAAEVDATAAPPASSSSETAAPEADSRPGYTRITADMVWGDIREAVRHKYKYTLDEDVHGSLRKLLTLRNLCQKLGVTMAARDYDFSKEDPLALSDVQDLQPTVKHAIPVCKDARQLVEQGRKCLNESNLNKAYELFSEANNILTQVCGPLHREVGNCYRFLAMVLYHAGELQAAIQNQQRELIINERCLSLDHPDTAHSYGNMALFYHGLGQTELALRHMSRTLQLLGVTCGPNHPDVAATFINLAMMYQDTGKMSIALRYLQEALKRNEKLLGPEHNQTAMCYHALAIAFSAIGAYKLSVQHEKSAHSIFLKHLGENDPRTLDSATWVRTFTHREKQAQVEKQRGLMTQQAAASFAESIKNKENLMAAMQAAARWSGSGRDGITRAAVERFLRGEVPVGVGGAAPVPPNQSPPIPSGRGRGHDERGRHAAAEARKKLNDRKGSEASGIGPRDGAAGEAGGMKYDELLSLLNSLGANSTGPAASKSASVTAAAAARAQAASATSATGPAVARPSLASGVASAIPLGAASAGKIAGKSPASAAKEKKDGGSSGDRSPAAAVTAAPLGLGGGLANLDKKKARAKKEIK